MKVPVAYSTVFASCMLGDAFFLKVIWFFDLFTGICFDSVENSLFTMKVTLAIHADIFWHGVMSIQQQFCVLIERFDLNNVIIKIEHHSNIDIYFHLWTRSEEPLLYWCMLVPWLRMGLFWMSKHIFGHFVYCRKEK